MGSAENTATDTPFVTGATEEEIKSFKIDKYLISLMLNEPFFSHILRTFNKVKSDSIPTAGVAVRDYEVTLLWNPSFLASLKSKQVKGTLKHECYHVIFKHCTARKRTPHILWNWATDLAINSMISEDELPDGGLIPGKELDLSKVTDPEMLKKWQPVSDLIASLPKRMASEWYFAKLQNDKDISETIESAGSKTFVFDDHGEWGEMSDEERQVMEGKIKQALSESVKRCDSSGQWGSVSSEMRETLRELVSDIIPWQALLKSFCGRTQRMNKRRTMKRINRKYPYIHSGIRRDHTSSIAIYMDQSGSVSSSDIELLFGELNNLAKKVTFHLFPFDTSVDEENSIEWRKGRKVPPYRNRSGGTCFAAVQKHFDKNSERFDGMIVLTDGECYDPGPSRKRRAWVIVPNRKLYFDPHPSDIVINMSEKHK